MQNPSLKAPRHKFVWFGHAFNIWMYGAQSNSGHPFLISSDNLHDEVTKRSGRHDPSMVIIREQTFRLWTCRSISHANNWLLCPFHVPFVPCHFPCIVFFPFCFAFIAFIVPSTFRLSVCVAHLYRCKTSFTCYIYTGTDWQLECGFFL